MAPLSAEVTGTWNVSFCPDKFQLSVEESAELLEVNSFMSAKSDGKGFCEDMLSSKDARKASQSSNSKGIDVVGSSILTKSGKS